MSLATSHYQLASAQKTVEVHWERTCRAWRDAVRHDFTEQFWAELEARLPAVIAATDRLDQFLSRMRQECGDGS